MLEKIIGVVFIIVGLLTIFSKKFTAKVLNYNHENGLMYISVGLLLILVGAMFFKKNKK